MRVLCVNEPCKVPTVKRLSLYIIKTASELSCTLPAGSVAICLKVDLGDSFMFFFLFFLFSFPSDLCNAFENEACI